MLRNKQPRLFLNKDLAVGGPVLPGVVNVSQKEIFVPMRPFHWVFRIPVRPEIAATQNRVPREWDHANFTSCFRLPFRAKGHQPQSFHFPLVPSLNPKKRGGNASAPMKFHHLFSTFSAKPGKSSTRITCPSSRTAMPVKRPKTWCWSLLRSLKSVQAARSSTGTKFISNRPSSEVKVQGERKSSPPSFRGMWKVTRLSLCALPP